MKEEERGSLNIGQKVYMVYYGKCLWGIGKENEYRIYKGTVRRKPKCDKSIVIVDFGKIDGRFVGTTSIEMSELFLSPEEAAENERLKLIIKREELNQKEINLIGATLEAEKLREQGSLDLGEKEQPQKEECE